MLKDHFVCKRRRHGNARVAHDQRQPAHAPAEFSGFIKSEVAKYSELIRDVGIKAN